MYTRAHPVTCTTYSRSSGWRWRARLAAATNSLRVSINWSVVSGVNDTSPHLGQTQAGTSGIVTPMPSSLYLKVVVPHSITSPHSEQWGAGLCSFIFLFFAGRGETPKWSHRECMPSQTRYRQGHCIDRLRVDRLPFLWPEWSGHRQEPVAGQGSFQWSGLIEQHPLHLAEGNLLSPRAKWHHV